MAPSTSDRRPRHTPGPYAVAIVAALALSARPAHADTGRQLEAELTICIDTTSPLTFARFNCVNRAYFLWVEQKTTININIGLGARGGVIPLVQPDAAGDVTVTFQTTGPVPLERIDLYLLTNTFNGNPPDFGLGRFLGSSAGGPFVFNSALAGSGEVDGVLVAIARFPGHDPEVDGDYAAAYFTTVPEPATLLLVTSGLVALGGLAARRRFARHPD